MYSIEEVENRQNVKLPSKYKQFYLSNFNGVEKCSQIYRGNDKIVIKKFMSAYEIISTIDEFYDYFSYSIIPIIITEYDDYICFYYNDQVPSIIYWNYELATENPDEAITYLYKNFDEFVNALC